MSHEAYNALPQSEKEPAVINTETSNKHEGEAKDTALSLEDTQADGPVVNFINGRADVVPNPVAAVDTKCQPKFCGLSKEAVGEYADDPYWIKIRWGLLILFWLAWFAMLIAAVVIIIIAPK